MKFYVQQAVRPGGSETELAGFVAIASATGDCVGEMWGLKTFKAYKKLKALHNAG